jgi:methylmalonyl-CoA carboxyltransferase 12S subunit
VEPNITPSTETPTPAGMAPVTEVLAPEESRKSPPSAKIPSPSTDITPDILMVMSASIAAYLGKTVRIRRVRFIDPHQANSWGQASRVVLQSSHILRRDHS